MLKKLRDALLTVLPDVYHFNALKTKPPYIVWAEDGQSRAMHSDGRMNLQVVTGTIDYFTKTEYDKNFHNIQAALNGLGIGWRLNSIQQEDELIHYEWVFDIAMNPEGE